MFELSVLDAYEAENDAIRSRADAHEIDELKTEIKQLKARFKPLADCQIYDELCAAGLLGATGQAMDPVFLEIARAIERAHGIK